MFSLIYTAKQRLQYLSLLLIMLASAASATETSHASAVELSEQEQQWLQQHPVIRASNNTQWAPFGFVEDGKSTGFSVDYLNLIAARTGLRLQWINDASWYNQLQLARDQQVDLLHSVTKTRKRQSFLRFTRAYIDNPYTLYFPAEQASDLNLADWLKQRKTISALKGLPVQELFAKLSPQPSILWVDTPLSGLDAVNNGAADAYLSQQKSTEFQIRRHNIGGLRGIALNTASPLNQEQMHFAARHDWPELASILEKGMAAISEQEIQQLLIKWSLAAPTPNISLTEQQLQWLSQQNELKLGVVPGWAPFGFVDDGYTGIAKDYLDTITNQLKLSLAPIPDLSWPELLEQARQGKLDVITAIVRTPEREQFLNFTKPYLQLPQVIVTHESASLINSLADLKGKTVAVPHQFVTEHLLEENHPGLRILLVDTIEEGLRSVSNGSAYATISNIASVHFHRRHSDMDNLKVAAVTPYEYAISIGVSKALPELVPILNRALDSFSELNKHYIQKKWTAMPVDGWSQWKTVWHWTLAISALLIITMVLVLFWNRRLAHEVVERKRAEEAAEAANQYKTRFLASVSHELRTPLNAILGFTEILLGKEPEADKRNHLDTINSAGQSLLQMINGLLDMSRIEAGKLELQPSVFSLPKLLEELQSLFKLSAQEKGLQLRYNIDPIFSDYVELDRLRLLQVLVNLISNALKFTEQGEIIITVSTANDNALKPGIRDLLIQVSDSGIGIPADQQQRIFEHFSQVQGQDSSKYGGSGLGLSICQQIIQLQAGRISVDSTPGAGSTFSVYLPAVRLLKNLASGDTDAKPKTARALQFKPTRLLIADDVEFNRQLIKGLLKNQPFAIAEASDGQQLLDMAFDKPPQLILTDINMPVLDGYQVAKQLKADPRTQDIPVIAVTAAALSQEREAISRHCDGYISKPFNQQALLQEIARQLPEQLDAVSNE